MKFGTMLLAGAILVVPRAYASELPPGLQCDTVATLTEEPAHRIKNLRTQMDIKFVEHSWRVVSQDGVLKSDITLKPMRITDDAYVLAESSDEVTARGVHVVTSPLTVDRKTGEYSVAVTSEMAKAPGAYSTINIKGHCVPADL